MFVSSVFIVNWFSNFSRQPLPLSVKAWGMRNGPGLNPHNANPQSILPDGYHSVSGCMGISSAIRGKPRFEKQLPHLQRLRGEGPTEITALWFSCRHA
jgi:hypothetical protein